MTYFTLQYPERTITNVDTENPTISIYDLTGKLLTSQTTASKKGTVNLSLTNFATGMYVVVLKENGYISMQKKLIIN